MGCRGIGGAGADIGGGGGVGLDVEVDIILDHFQERGLVVQHGDAWARKYANAAEVLQEIDGGDQVEWLIQLSHDEICHAGDAAGVPGGADRETGLVVTQPAPFDALSVGVGKFNLDDAGLDHDLAPNRARDQIDVGLHALVLATCRANTEQAGFRVGDHRNGFANGAAPDQRFAILPLGTGDGDGLGAGRVCRDVPAACSAGDRLGAEARDAL